MKLSEFLKANKCYEQFIENHNYWKNIYLKSLDFELENDMLWLLDEPKKDTQPDLINPNHYKIGGIETIDYMKAKSTKEEFRGHLRLTALKYLSRYGKKDNELQELKKAKWYLDYLIKELENETK